MKRPEAEGFACVNRDVFLTMLDDILAGNGGSEWVREVAKKLHFGVIHGMGEVADLVKQAKEEERERCARRLEEMGEPGAAEFLRHIPDPPIPLTEAEIAYGKEVAARLDAETGSTDK